MAWNEPGKGRDPWGNRGGNGQGGGGGGNDGPPDLDEVFRNLKRRLSSAFGGGSGGGGGRGAAGGQGPTPALVGTIVAVLLVVWGLSGFYMVDDAERGVVQRLGAFERTEDPGLHWHIPWPVETVSRVNVNEIRRYNHSTLMLTEDENIVDIDVNVQFRIADPQAYLFNVEEPERTLREVTESAVREVVGTNNLGFIILGDGRTFLEMTTIESLQTTLNSYQAGIVITQVNLQDANFPEPVQPAVEDAITAREDRERKILEAEQYANDRVPRARGAAARRIEEGEGYRARVVNQSEGDASRFTQLLAEYEAAPDVTRERLYMETMEEVLGRTPKVLMDVSDGAGNMIYLPVDQLLKRHAGSDSDDDNGADSDRDRRAEIEEQPRLRQDLRTRGGRR